MGPELVNDLVREMGPEYTGEGNEQIELGLRLVMKTPAGGGHCQ
jgi:hypothetical protein